MRTGIGRRRGPIDAVLVALVRLVVDDSWTPAWAAERLREQVDDERALRRARDQVGWALADRPSAFGERAAATLDAALALPSSFQSIPATNADGLVGPDDHDGTAA